MKAEKLDRSLLKGTKATLSSLQIASTCFLDYNFSISSNYDAATSFFETKKEEWLLCVFSSNAAAPS